MTRILIVDDNWLLCEELKGQLEDLGYEIAGRAPTPQKGIKMALELMPDIVLMDIRFPGRMDGIAASEEIRAEADIPIIFISGYGDKDLIDRAKRIEPLAYIMKPYNPLEIRAAIEITLYRREVEGQLRKARHELEQVVAQRTALLAHANEKLNALMNASPDSALLLDLDGRIVAANDVAAARFGVPIDAFIGTQAWELLPPDLAKIRKAKIDRVILSGKPLRFEDVREGMTFDNTVYPVFDGEGEVVQVAVYGKDITRLAETIQALTRSEMALAEKNHAAEDATAALGLLLKRREQDRIDLEDRMVSNMQKVIRPQVSDLRKTLTNDAQKAILNELEANLRAIITPFARDLSSGVFNLTPMEIRVAALVKERKTNIEMAKRLGLSKNTILAHRFNIRTKLGIKGTDIKLRAFLQKLG